jgi:Aldehyde dehydrogenase family
MRAAADRIVSVSLELGGKSPSIVYPDADEDWVGDGVIAGMRFTRQSQSCTAGSRLFLHAEIYDSFLDKLRTKTEALKLARSTRPSSRFASAVIRWRDLARSTEQGVQQQFEPKRLLQTRAVGEPGHDIACVVAGGKDDWHAFGAQDVGDGINHLAAQVDVQHRAVDLLLAGGYRQGIVQVPGRTDDVGALRPERLRDHICDHKFVLDHENATTRHRV